MALLVSSYPCICSALVQVSDTSAINPVAAPPASHAHLLSFLAAAQATALDSDRPNDPSLGTPVRSIIDEFLEKFQTAFDPPPALFWEKCCDFFLRIFLERK